MFVRERGEKGEKTQTSLMMDRQLRVVVGSIYARAYFCSVRVWERQTDRQTDRQRGLWSVVTFAKYRTTRRRSPERSLAREDSEIVIEIRQRRHGPRES